MMVPALLLCLFLSLHRQATADGGHVRCRSIDCPKYTVVEVDDVRNFEVREYESPLWVFVKHHQQATSYQQALSAQAPILSDYMKGNNDFNTTISETAPAVTVVIPGLYHANDVGAPFGDAYRFARYLPQNVQLTAPPTSNNTVRFWRFPPENQRVVVKKFREGAINDATIAHAVASLRNSLKGSTWESRVRPCGGFAVADYNYPDTNGTTKNEIMLLAEKEWLSGGGQ
ncbi:uncharacterized protein LOC116257179 [Nymphaea colorata]|uniref:uncharacterized protein LOC116257179 n=1 Tax=Nymphaea colorata TaxID=210225 RepID=UPI00129EE266|nr:uncharacterized protein LOC116257179 [Nymphaea colorata]